MLVKVPFFSTWLAAGQEEDLGGDVGRRDLAGLDLGRVVPEGRRLDLDQVADHEPVEIAQGGAVVATVGRADGRVLAHDEEALDRPVDHPRQRRVVGVVAGQARQVAEAEVVLGGGRVAPPRLQQRDGVGAHVGPVAGRRRALLDVLLQRPVRLGRGHRQVARQDVVERRDVGRALDRRVAAQGHDAAARPADVAQQQLDDRGGADVLHPHRVLGPPDGVAERARALAARVVAQRLAHLEELSRARRRTSARRTRACSGRSAGEAAGRRSAGAAASRRSAAARPPRARRRGRRGPPVRWGRRSRAAPTPPPLPCPRTARTRGRRCASRDPSQRRARRDPRCRGSPRRRSSPRWCSGRRTP